MLLSKEAITKWHYKNKEIYESKGYIFTKWKDEIKIEIEDLPTTSNVMVEVKCDYCGISNQVRYCDYLEYNKNNLLHKDCCKKCIETKKLETLKFKLENNLIDYGEKGYWLNTDNIKFELNNYIIKNKTVLNIRNNKKDNGNKIYYAIKERNLEINNLITELGYEIKDVNYKQTFIYKDEKIMKEIINDYINQCGRFPTLKNFKNDLNIDTHCISMYGGINNLKRLVDWNDKENLKDKNNWYNRSSYEYIVAQYLIHNNISYKREQHPFPSTECEYRSDFTFETIENKVIHCEIWGMESEEYFQNKEMKINLYKKYNIELISINYDIFQQPYKDIQESLFIIFQNYFNLEYRTFDNVLIIPVSNLTDEEIACKLLQHSKDGITLPTVKYLKKNHIYMLYYIAFMRYGSYQIFAEKFNLTTTKPKMRR